MDCERLKVKQSHYRLGQAQRLPDFKIIGTWRLSALRAGRLYPTGNIPGTHFCLRLSWFQGHSVARRVMWIKKSSDTIGNRTSDIPACSTVTQPNAPSGGLIKFVPTEKKIYIYIYMCVCMYIRIPFHFYKFQPKILKHNVFILQLSNSYIQYFDNSVWTMYPNSCCITKQNMAMSCSTENIQFTQQDSFINSNSFIIVKKKVKNFFQAEIFDSSPIH